MDKTEAYVWLDKIKRDLEDDAANDERIEAVKFAQKVLREKITGESE